MPTSKRKENPQDGNTPASAHKKRSLEESRAAAKEYRESLKRKSTSGSPSSASDTPQTPTSVKKPRRQELKTPQSLQEDKIEARIASRKRAQQYAQSLSAIDHGGAGAGPPNTIAGGTSDSDDRYGSDANASISDGVDSSDVDMGGGMEPPPSRKGRLANHVAPPGRVTSHVAPPRRVTNHVAPPPREQSAPLKTPPPMPQIFTDRRQSVPSVPPFVGTPHQTPAKSVPTDAGRRSTGRSTGLTNPSHRSSFLRHAVQDEGAAAADATLAGTTGSRTPALPAGGGDEPAVAPPGGPSRRQSFLRRADGKGEETAAASKEAAAPAVVSPCKKVEAHQGGAKSSRRRPDGGRVGVWASTCMVALVPLVLSCLLWGVLVPVWPRIRLEAGNAWSAVSVVTVENTHQDKCFLTSDQDASICRVGTSVLHCPAPAVCDLGRILSCDVPFEKAKDGTACVLSAAVKKETDTVVTALRELTVEQHCRGGGILFPRGSSRRSLITLTEAAALLDSEPLSLLASMPAGNVAGLIDLEGEPAEAYGGGQDGAGGEVGSGSERVARLSDAVAGAVALPWGCRSRLAAGNVLLAHWKMLVAFCAMCLAIVSYDIRRLMGYRRRVKVCTMRDEAYKALLEHTAGDSSPMQTSHIQDFVGDRRRANGEGTTAKTQRNVRRLWHLVENEVEHDTRIRRSYRNMRGQHNVDCWQWVGPSSATLETIGVLDPGPAPRLWLLWSLKQRMRQS